MLSTRRLPRLAATVVSAALLATVALTGPASATALPTVPPRAVDLSDVRGYPGRAPSRSGRTTRPTRPSRSASSRTTRSRRS